MGLTPFILIDEQGDPVKGLARASKLGFDGYLPNPLCPADLLAIVQTSLQERQQLAQAIAGELPAEDADFEISLGVRGHELKFNTRLHHIYFDGRMIQQQLTPSEILLLACLAE